MKQRHRRAARATAHPRSACLAPLRFCQMNDPNTLPMPSDLAGASDKPHTRETAVEPPSVKLIVRLFLIPLFIVAAAVGVMFLIGLMAGREPSFDEAIARLKNAGGGCTAD